MIKLAARGSTVQDILPGLLTHERVGGMLLLR